MKMGSVKKDLRIHENGLKIMQAQYVYTDFMWVQRFCEG